MNGTAIEMSERNVNRLRAKLIMEIAAGVEQTSCLWARDNLAQSPPREAPDARARRASLCHWARQRLQDGGYDLSGRKIPIPSLRYFNESKFGGFPVLPLPKGTGKVCT